ncbi:MAG: polyprenyl synthetase family protein [Chloroflexi bacterium]|nr:polyprenyl synthetase family protein [Chloroflexota bacterium]MYF79868.1 polyprenyl synthetase family protein [Chloroflexota bacterium]MYK62486.1 polyprenyl synthetase family protein [Chloroflexota bacterium]
MTTIQTTPAQDIFAPIEQDLDRVVEVITQLSIEEIERCPAGIDALETLDERLTHVMSTPGKKMRPAMTLLASKLWGAVPDEKMISMAVAVELLHIAALIHDDTVDDADVRRGKATAGFLWGNNFAVLLGDYVFATSAKFVCATGSVRLISRFAETIAELARGELHEMVSNWNLPVTVDEYFARIYDKTASLFSTSAESGAVLGSADEDAVNALREYGYYLGMAYQVKDDVLDYESTTDELGKPANQDILSGKLTLPAIYASENPDCAAAIEGFFNLSENEREAALGELLDTIRHNGGVERAEATTSEFIDTALKRLEVAPPSVSRDSLASIASRVNSM